MILTLFRKECSQTAKSLIYWLYVACLVLFFSARWEVCRFFPHRWKDRRITVTMDFVRILRRKRLWRPVPGAWCGHTIMMIM